jgi:four helix bundle protein
MLMMKNFRDLRVWQESHTLTLEVYRVTKKFPRDEIYGLTSQIRRSSSSIPANIAEGCGRDGDAELQRFLTIASGSASELDYHFLLAKDLEYCTPTEYETITARLSSVRKMLNTFIQKLKANRQ